MFTFSLIYIFIYYQLLSLIFIYLYIYVNTVDVQRWNISNLFYFIKNYTSNSNNFFLLPLLLSGLPPVSFFLLKLTFLLKIFSNITLFLQILFFINFLLGMFFYLQLFNMTINSGTNTKLLIGTNTKNFNILLNNREEVSNKAYIYWYTYTLIVYINIFNLFFFFDIYLILSTLH